uniref:Heavy metal associated n=1 Tax=Echinococcus granulosus TaxID=6210 RepID=A0A068WF63_ECHGR|nr:Heavy metal associated [Echinococcus granulosus]
MMGLKFEIDLKRLLSLDWDWVVYSGFYGNTLSRLMGPIRFTAHHILTVGTCGLFLCALIYFLYRLLHLYLNRNILVECWFCQSLTTVKVSDRNAFFCFSCKQYNGFTESGDYNRSLPAQYDASLNPRGFILPRNSSIINNSKSDILCSLCTQRQAYKINQLARFEPSNEANWDRELSQFKKELESRCVLCPSCTIKVHRRINQIDAKILPSVLSWWRNRDHKNSIVDTLPNERFQGSLSSPTSSYIILAAIRIVTTLVWLSLGIPLLLGFLHHHVCHPHSRSSLKRFVKMIDLNIPQHDCEYIADYKSVLKLQPNHALWGHFLCAFGHLVLLLQTFRPASNLILALLDFILFVLATDLIITRLGFDSIQTLTLLALLLVASTSVLFYKWLTCREGGVKEQKRKLTAAWSSLASPHSNPPSYDAASAASSRFPKSNVSGAHSLSLDRLSLHSAYPPTAYSTIFSPPTVVHSPLRSHIYAANAAPGYTCLRQGGGEGDDVNEVMSHFTSVSRCSMSRSGQSRRQHRKRQQLPVGLLRWILYLLFGRLEKWEDVRVELVCLLNAVLVTVLLVLICHLFYSIVPALWNMKL